MGQWEVTFRVRRADDSDSAGIVAVWRTIAEERIYSAVDEPWTVEQERAYLKALSPREAVHIAVAGSGTIAGFQSLDLWAASIRSMMHVAQIGTFLLPEWRRCGVGSALFEATRAFARDVHYGKIVAQVRASNGPAQAFYHRLGFRACGRLTRQVRIDGMEDDEILMEFFL
ncbi:MAG: GNAT family N-acetyltransferase [Bryobacterales bacterium]|nr:GNAT family N-acetyltransferase [Bryobacterales bacterium]